MSHENVIKAVRELINVPDDSTFEYVWSKIDAVEQALTAYDKEQANEGKQPEGKTILQELVEEFENIKKNKCKTLQEVMFFDGVLAIIDAKYLNKEKKAMQLYASQQVSKATKDLTDEVERLKTVITAKNETINELIDALKELCELKHYKDNVGRDSIYRKRQPEAWKQANALLNNLIGYGENSDNEDWSGGIAYNH